MKIAIDCRSLRKRPAGVPNFLIPVINSLAIHKKDWTIYLLSNEDFDPQAEARMKRSPNVIKVITPTWIFPNVAFVWYLFKMPFMIRRIGINIFYSPIPNLPLWLPKKIRTIISVHDMVYKQFPETMSKANLLINRLLHDRSINRADSIWSVSNFTKHEIESRFPERHCKNIFVGSSVDKNLFHTHPLSLLGGGLSEKYGLKQRFIHFVGTLEPRKNLPFLISLRPELAKQDYSLLIVGAQGWGEDKDVISRIPEAIFQQSVKFSGFISTEELVNLYCAADVYVSTALNEGFGLPQLEAMCCGCPVVSPHNSAMIEIVEGAGETVKGWDKKEWVDTILKVSSNRQYYISRGFQRAEAYDWNRVIEGLVHYLAGT